MTTSPRPWYPRTVFLVRNVEQALAHYIEVLGFAAAWRHEEEDQLVAAQVERDGLEIILNRNRERAGQGRIFLTLEQGQVADVVAGLRQRGAEVTPGHWGMPILAVRDLDGNELFFFDDARPAGS